MSNPEGSIRYLQGATLLTQDNQRLAIGSVNLYPTVKTGEFYPETLFETTLENLPQLSATLQLSDGRSYKLKLDKMCQVTGKVPHFDFDYQ